MLDFGKVKLQHGEHMINKNALEATHGLGSSKKEAGPDFKHVYKEFGPSNPGEYIGEDGKPGVYCISFKDGIAFTYPVNAPEGFSKLDFVRQVAVLDSNACGTATSMVVFRGRSWPLARADIYTADMSDLPLSPSLWARREGVPAEIDFARVHDRGRIELLRRDAPAFMLRLGETTQQDLLTELGPPDSIFKQDKNKAMTHKRRTSSMNSARARMNLGTDRAASETDGSDAWSDEDEDEDETVINEMDDEDVGTWWNYFAHGLDVLISQAHQLPAASPTAPQTHAENDSRENTTIARNHLTVTKVCLHSNIPGAWQFNRHRRLRWSFDSWPLPADDEISSSTYSTSSNPLTSEHKFRAIQTHLRAVFRETYATELEQNEQQQPQAFNRDWGDNSSLGNSVVELLGAFDEGAGGRQKAGVSDSAAEYGRLGEVLVYGFPGLAFEVLKNGCVAWVQIW